MTHLSYCFLSQSLGFIKISNAISFHSSFSTNTIFLVRSKSFLFRPNDEKNHEEHKSPCYLPNGDLGVTK